MKQIIVCLLWLLPPAVGGAGNTGKYAAAPPRIEIIPPGFAQTAQDPILQCRVACFEFRIFGWIDWLGEGRAEWSHTIPSITISVLPIEEFLCRCTAERSDHYQGKLPV